ncbi:MAG: hypothetical protein AAF441_10085 [Pseudomonadota bacterium]
MQFDPPPDYDNIGDMRPVLAYVAVLGTLWLLPWLGFECLFGWCVVQSDSWWLYAPLIALPFLLFIEYPLRLFDRLWSDYAGVDRDPKEFFSLRSGDGGPMGEHEDVLATLKRAFPETAWELVTETPEPEIPLNGAYAKFSYWLWMKFDRTRYPYYEGFLGWAGMFRIAHKSPVEEVRVRFWSTPGHDAQLQKLLEKTGWAKEIIQERKGLFGLFRRR